MKQSTPNPTQSAPTHATPNAIVFSHPQALDRTGTTETNMPLNPPIQPRIFLHNFDTPSIPQEKVSSAQLYPIKLKTQIKTRLRNTNSGLSERDSGTQALQEQTQFRETPKKKGKSHLYAAKKQITQPQPGKLLEFQPGGGYRGSNRAKEAAHFLGKAQEGR